MNYALVRGKNPYTTLTCGGARSTIPVPALMSLGVKIFQVLNAICMCEGNLSISACELHRKDRSQILGARRKGVAAGAFAPLHIKM